MHLYLLAMPPTDSVTHGYLPAAERMGLDITLLTDRPQDHNVRGDHGASRVDVVGCDVQDVRAVISRISTGPAPAAVFTNSDHLQTSAALAAEYFGLPAKSWPATVRTKDKALMRRHLAAAGLDVVHSTQLRPDDPLELLHEARVPLPCVVKPREGVASEDVALARTTDELVTLADGIRRRRPGAAVVAEEYLPGDLCTLETIGDGNRRHVLGGFRTRLSPLPHFIEESMTWTGLPPTDVLRQVLDQLDALDVRLGACHTEFVVHEGRARLVEVNYRSIGDQCDLLLADLLGIDYFGLVLRAHLGDDLPEDLAPRTTRTARLDYPCATSAGTLTAAPTAQDLTVDDARITYRPLRGIGVTAPLHHTNRDYLGVLRTTGADVATVDRAARDFLAAHRWEITA